jgi:hypothetical protein
MGFTWTQEDLPVMGYQILYYDQEYRERVMAEIEMKALIDLVSQLRRGALIREGDGGWELCFKATALIRKKLHPVTHKPIGDIDYATDLDFDDIVLYSKTEDGLANFTSWMAENNFT